MTKPSTRSTALSLLICFLCYILGAYANPSMRYGHMWRPFPTNVRTSITSRSRRGPLYKQESPRYDDREVILAARPSSKAVASNSQQQASEVPTVTFDDLGPVGKLVASVTQIGTTVILEYCTSFVLGYAFGTIIGVPGLIFRPVEPGVPKMLMSEVKGRFGRMNGRAMKFGRNLGGVSATFKGADVAVSLLRYQHREDMWNEVFSSAAAGAIFARKEGPTGMVRGALLWGSMIYVLRGPLQANNRRITSYTEEPIEF